MLYKPCQYFVWKGKDGKEIEGNKELEGTGTNEQDLPHKIKNTKEDGHEANWRGQIR